MARVPLRERVSARAAALTAAALVAVVAVVLVVVIGGGNGKVTRPPGAIEACNGYPELCDRHLNEVVFAGAHNAMSAASEPGWYTPNQETGIPQQLDAGIRALLIDTYYGVKRSDGPVVTDLEKQPQSKVVETAREKLGDAAAKKLQALVSRFARRGGEGEPGTYLCHIACELGSTDLVKALIGVREFLDTHPDEFVIIFIEDRISPEDTEQAFKESGLVRYAYVHTRDEPFPTLRELIRTDRRVLAMAEEDSGGGSIPWYHDGFELGQETPYTFGSPGDLEDYRSSCMPNRGDTQGPLFLLNHWVERLPRSPDLGAEVNAYDFLLRRARACRERRDLPPTIVAVDFYDEGQVIEAARKLNGIPRDAEPSYREVG